MWKQAYEKVKRQQRGRKAELSPVDKRVSALEECFFSQLSEFIKRHEEEGYPRSRSSNGEGEDRYAALSDHVTLPLPEDADAPAEPEDKAKLLSDVLGTNLEVLYEEILHFMMHIVGCDTTTIDDQESIFRYLQAAFAFDNLKHNELLEQAKAKEAPDILLHVEVIKAKDLKSMDSNGLSDTYCTLYLTSAEQHKYNTSVKTATLCPEWREHFCLPVTHASEDILCLEAWDFDPAETIRMKVGKINTAKGMKGWGKLVREFGSIGKVENEFIGRALLPLNSISPSGETRWCHLEKEGKSRKRGSVKLELTFSSERNPEAAFKDHRHLLRLLLLHQLENDQDEPYTWDGNFKTPAEIILTQHRVQSGLNTTMELLAKWVEFCYIHKDYPMSFEIFPILLRNLLPDLQIHTFDQEKENLFWEAAKNLLPSCVKGIKRLHTLIPNDKNIHQMAAILRIISYLRCIKSPEGFELFPTSIYGWLLPCEDNCNYDVIAITKQAIVKGTEEWYEDLLRNSVISDQNFSGEARLNYVIKIIKDAMKDLCRATDIYESIFQENLQVSYAPTIYSAHDYKISELVEPIITEVYEVLKPLKFDDVSAHQMDEDGALSLGMQLFDLYLTLQRFVVSGTGLCSEVDTFKLSQYHIWFHKGVTQWLDIALWKALRRIKKAVELDKLVPMSNVVQRSSSAVDTLDIYNQIKIFWQQLSWPDMEGSYVFVSKIIDDICCCSIFYADTMRNKVEDLNHNPKNSGNNYKVSKEWCLAINNIEYIWHSIDSFVDELGLNDILEKIGNSKGKSGAEQCRQSLQLVIDNTVETVDTKISELLEREVEKMIPAIEKYLLEGEEEMYNREIPIDKLLHFLDENLTILHSNLSKELFQKMLLVMWGKVASILFSIVEKSLQGKSPRTYFCNLQKTVGTLVDFFKGGGEEGDICNVKALKELEEILSLHSMETSQLIQKFYLERLEEQKSMSSAPRGVITICTHFAEHILKIQILSCRNLPPMDSNGSSDPFVEVVLLPTEIFVGIHKQKTKTEKKTLFPLFDESFLFKLSPEQRQARNGMVLFTVKDYDIIGNDFVGEAYIQFSEIQKENSMENGELKQIHLNLSYPKNLDSQVSKALKHRQGDKIAKEFMKKEKAKAEAH